MVRGYQVFLSPLKVILGTRTCCRFTPTCSQYAIEALEAHGVVRGLYLGARRVLRCHPWGGMGYDPVPSRNKTGGRKNKPVK